MIYFARTLFLIATLFLGLGLCVLAAKVLFETYIPEPYKGYWVEALTVIIVGVLLAGIANRLGNDLIGPKKAIKDRVEKEYQELRREDPVTKSWIADEVFSSLIYLLKNIK